MKFKSEYLFATFILFGVALFSISGLPIMMMNKGIDVTITIIFSIVLLIVSSLLAILNYSFYNLAKSKEHKVNAYDEILKMRQNTKIRT